MTYSNHREKMSLVGRTCRSLTKAHSSTPFHLLGRLNGEVWDADVVGAALLLDGDGVGGHRLELPQHRHQLPPQPAGGGGDARAGQRVLDLKPGIR